MSLPFYVLTCTGCDYTDSYGHGVRFQYSGPPEHQPVRGVGWCKDCDRIANVCAPFTRDHAEAEIKDIETWITQNKRGLFARFSRTKKDEILKSQQRIRAIQARLTHFQSADFKPRCLSCGGHTVLPFELPYGDYGVRENLNIKHTCGGELMICMDGHFSYRRLPTVLFDAWGAVINDERKPSA